MSRLPKGEASADAANPAVPPDPAETATVDAGAAEAAVSAANEPFNGADPAAFDHDGDGAPGGSLPLLDAAVLLRPAHGHRRGVVVRGSADQIAALGDGARPATSADLAVAGHNVRDI